MQNRLLLVAALVGAQFTAIPAFAVSASVREPFTEIFFSPTDGRVGYRLGSGFKIYDRDVPQGNTGEAVTGTCDVHWDYVSHVGDLPPGIEVHIGAGTPYLFAGTPRQPGTWAIIANLRVECHGGPDQKLYERKVRVTFNIEP